VTNSAPIRQATAAKWKDAVPKIAPE